MFAFHLRFLRVFRIRPWTTFECDSSELRSLLQQLCLLVWSMFRDYSVVRMSQRETCGWRVLHDEALAHGYKVRHCNLWIADLSLGRSTLIPNFLSLR